MTGFRIVSGARGARPVAKAAVGRMACELADRARALGFAVGRIETSRCTVSASRYLHLLEGGREWIVRVSDHRRPADAAQAAPHLDLVSLDGAAGLDEAAAFLARVHAGGVAWTRPVRGAHRADGRR